MVAMRLLWVLEHVPGLREAADRGEAMFGCVDTWLLYKLTGKHVTEGQCGDTGVMHPCLIVMRSVQHRGHGYIRPLHPPVRGLGLQHVQHPHGHDANNRGQRRRPFRHHQAG